MTAARRATRSKHPQQPMAIQKIGLLPFFAGGAPAGIWGTGDAGPAGRKRSLAAAALGGVGGGGVAPARGSGGGPAGFGVGGIGGGGTGGGAGAAITVAESSAGIGAETVASGSSRMSTRNASAPNRSSWLFLSACSA